MNARMKLYWVTAIVLISSCLSTILEYKKNSKDIFSSKPGPVRTKDIDDLETIKAALSRRENTMIVFHAEWCGHCRDFIPKYDEVSTNPLTKGFNLFKVNCSKKTDAGSNDSICKEFEVSKYPTLKVFVNGTELDSEPSRDKIHLIEYLNKLSEVQVQIIESEEFLRQFNSDYGDVSFVFVNPHHYDNIHLDSVSNTSEEQRQGKEFFDCMISISKDIRVSQYHYLGYVSKVDLLGSHYNLESRKPLVIVSGSNWRSNVQLEYTGSCESVNEFIVKNQYAVLKNLSQAYIKRLYSSNKKMILIALDLPKHQEYLDSIQPEIAVEYKEDYLTSYIDLNTEDNQRMFQFFKLGSHDLPKVILYDFSVRKYYIDANRPVNFDELKKSISLLVQNSDKLPWTTGHFIEDLLLKIGLELSERNIILILVGIFVSLIVGLLMCVFFCDSGNSNSNDDDHDGNTEVRHKNADDKKENKGKQKKE